jgi:hypothetical protein
MRTHTLTFSPEDYARAGQQAFNTALPLKAPVADRMLLAAVSVLYVASLFVIASGPNNIDAQSQRLLRGAAIALVVAPALFALVLFRGRRRAAVSFFSRFHSPPSVVDVAATEEGLSVVASGVRSHFQWSAIQVAAQDQAFACVLLPRSWPLPLPVRSFSTPEDFASFVRLLQERQRANAA